MLKSNILHFTDPDYDHLWEKLAGRDLNAVAANAEATLNADSVLSLRMLGADWRIDIPNRLIIGPSNRSAPDKKTALTLLFYLEQAKPEGLSAKLVTERNLPGGERFFSGGHALKKEPLTSRFGQDGEALTKALARLGGTTLESGPYLYNFWLVMLPKVPVQLNLSIGDEEFPAEINFSFDVSSEKHCPLPIIASLVSFLTELLLDDNCNKV